MRIKLNWVILNFQKLYFVTNLVVFQQWIYKECKIHQHLLHQDVLRHEIVFLFGVLLVSMKLLWRLMRFHGPEVLEHVVQVTYHHNFLIESHCPYLFLHHQQKHRSWKSMKNLANQTNDVFVQMNLFQYWLYDTLQLHTPSLTHTLKHPR